MVLIPFDAVIDIDLDVWKQKDHAGRLALIDHELTHVDLVQDEKNVIAVDDLNRPRWGLKPHDYNLSGFVDVVERHGNNAPEVEAFASVVECHEQLVFPFAQIVTGGPARPRRKREPRGKETQSTPTMAGRRAAAHRGEEHRAKD